MPLKKEKHSGFTAHENNEAIRINFSSESQKRGYIGSGVSAMHIKKEKPPAGPHRPRLRYLQLRQQRRRS